MSETTTEKTPRIFEALAGAMRDVEAVAKSRKNEQQGYKFRGIDDVYNVVHAALSKHGVITPLRVLERLVAERTSKNGTAQTHVTLKVEYDFTASDGSKMTVGPLWSEALDTSDKATNKAMAFAHKYALLQTFCIPTEDVAEGDKTTIEAGAKKGLDAIPSTIKRAVSMGEAVEKMAQGAPASDFVPKSKKAELDISGYSLDELRTKLLDKQVLRDAKGPGSPAWLKLDAHMMAIRAELALRAKNGEADEPGADAPFAQGEAP